MWQYIFAGLSAIVLFGFIVWCVSHFGLRTCYSEYGPLCRDNYKVNWWTFFTLLASLLLLPVILEASVGKAWQFTGFLCVVFLALIAFTPDYDKDKFILKLHLILAEGCALWAILYIIFCATPFWWIIPIYLGICAICITIFGKWSWNFWLEMAAFLFTYTGVFLII